MKTVSVEEFLSKLNETDYGKKYLELINRNWKLPNDYPKHVRVGDKKPGYEVHHIQPLSLGGKEKLNNRVYLSMFEHVLAHYYLALAYPCCETLYAFWCIGHATLPEKLQESERSTILSLEHYADLRNKANIVRSEKALGRVHPSESYQKGWETRRKNGTDRGWKHPSGSGQKGIKTRTKNGTLGKNNMALAWETRRKNGNDHVSEESKRKRLETLKTSEAWKNCHNSEVAAKIVESRKRNGTLKHSEETKQKISKALKGKCRVYDADGHYHYEHKEA